MSINPRYQAFLHSFLDTEQITQLLSACRKPLKKSITVADNFCRYRRLDLSQTPGWHLQKKRSLLDNHNYYIDREDTSVALGLTRPHQAGCMYIQESAASLPASIVPYHDTMSILDMCASPWGKTVQLVDRSRSYRDITIVANEPDIGRLHTLQENLVRMHASNVIYTNLDGLKFGDTMPEIFDCVLLDAPCSGEGTAFKSDDALSHRRIEEIKKIAHLQYKLLESAYHTCKVWGTIIYSTCTINPLENECNISQFLDMYQDSVRILPLHIAQCASWLVSNQYYPIDPQVSNNSIRCRPHLQYTGWFYIAMIQKTAWSSQTTSPKLSRHSRMPNTKRSPISKKTWSHISTYLLEQFGFVMSKHYRYDEDDQYIYAYDTGIDPQILPHAHTRWLPILKKLKHTQYYLPLSHLATLYHDQHSSSSVELTQSQLQMYLNGQSITVDGYPDGRYIVTHQQTNRTVAKCVWSVLKYKSMS